jgi:hypothetical protein
LRIQPRSAEDTFGSPASCAILLALEQGPTLLAIRRLTVRPQNVEVPADQVETLSIRLRIEGLALIRPPGNAP